MAAAGEVAFWYMNEAELRQWVEANPARVNDRDRERDTLLDVAVCRLKSLSLTVWLLDEIGADVNARSKHGITPLHVAQSLLDRNADPTLLANGGMSPLMHQMINGRFDIVKRLLQDPRVRASIDMQNRHGDTALHFACRHNETMANAMVTLLLEAGAAPILTNNDGKTPLAYLRMHHPAHHAAITLLEQALAATETTSLLVKARRLAVAARSNIVAPSCLQARVAQGQPLPRMTTKAASSAA